MKATNLASILAVSLALAGYSRWVLTRSENVPKPLADTSAVAGIPLLRMPDALALWKDNLTIFVDVRTPFEYEVGHIAGAMNVPEEEFEKRLPELKSRLEHAHAIVVYCKSRDCAKSLWSAIRLHQEGLTQTKIYPNGWNEWINNDLPSNRRTQ